MVIASEDKQARMRVDATLLEARREALRNAQRDRENDPQPPFLRSAYTTSSASLQGAHKITDGGRDAAPVLSERSLPRSASDGSLVAPKGSKGAWYGRRLPQRMTSSLPPIEQQRMPTASEEQLLQPSLTRARLAKIRELVEEDGESEPPFGPGGRAANHHDNNYNDNNQPSEFDDDARSKRSYARSARSGGARSEAGRSVLSGRSARSLARSASSSAVQRLLAAEKEEEQEEEESRRLHLEQIYSVASFYADRPLHPPRADGRAPVALSSDYPGAALMRNSNSSFDLRGGRSAGGYPGGGGAYSVPGGGGYDDDDGAASIRTGRSSVNAMKRRSLEARRVELRRRLGAIEHTLAKAGQSTSMASTVSSASTSWYVMRKGRQLALAPSASDLWRPDPRKQAAFLPEPGTLMPRPGDWMKKEGDE